MAKDHFEIIKSTSSPQGLAGVRMGKHKKFFGANSPVIRTDDEAWAKDVQQKYGQQGSNDVIVARVPNRDPSRIIATGFGPGKWDEIRKEKEGQAK